MRYRIVHRTGYAYASPVHESFNEVRLQPVSSETQTCLNFDLVIDPPVPMITYQDYYGNAVHDFGVPYVHDRLTIEATSDIVTFAGADEPLFGPRGGAPDASPALTTLVSDTGFSDDHAEFLSPSTFVLLEEASGVLARHLLAGDPTTSAYAFALRGAAYITSHFTYQVGVTTVRSTVADVLAGGSGVCQDFAHLFISFCRHLGLPARYVSGYLGDVEESGASHAWAEAYIPPYGWVGIDPTVGAVCTGRHVKIAAGRDYADVAVVRGTYRGGGEAALTVEVRGAVLDDAHDLSAAGRANGTRGRGKLIQYQTLGAMQQFQRRGAMMQTMGSTTQTMGAFPTDMPGQRDEPDIPRQQPQQQQQGSGERSRSEAGSRRSLSCVPTLLEEVRA
ncbi:MAG: transglutaminase family protein [Chloroflexota bacterium]|nr:transglutaminase family protein [Chloroflexota bacterium]